MSKFGSEDHLVMCANWITAFDKTLKVGEDHSDEFVFAQMLYQGFASVVEAIRELKEDRGSGEAEVSG